MRAGRTEDDDAFHRVRRAPGATMGRAEYNADFYGVYREMHGVLWKLERAQHFHEPYSPSWVAWEEGDWERSLALIEASRDEFEADLPPRVELRRLRVVERPLSRYLQWELRVLAARAGLGEKGRVLPAQAVRHLERDGPLPEILIPSKDLLYEILYDSIGAHVGGRRIEDRAVIEPCAHAVETLYDQAEDIATFVARELPPPSGAPFSPSLRAGGPSSP